MNDSSCKVTFQCEDIKTVAQMIEPTDDLVTSNIKKTGSTTYKYIVSTVHRSHLITLITKAIDITSISYLNGSAAGGETYTLVYKKLDPSSYPSPLQRWRHVA